MEKTYLISDAAKQVQVETHVLRYWEEELGLPIKRNKLGHRYYTGSDVEFSKEVKKMKDIGLDVPQVTELCYELQKAGIDIDTKILNVNEMVSALCQLK